MENPRGDALSDRWPQEGAVLWTRLQRVPALESQSLYDCFGKTSPLLLAFLHLFNKHKLGAETHCWGRAVCTPAGNTEYSRGLA